MSLNIGGLLGGVSSILGGVSSGNYLNAIQGGLSVASSFVPQPSAQPIYQPQQPTYGAVAQPVGAFSVPAAAAAAMVGRLAPVLTKIAVKLGLRAKPSLNRAMEIIRKTAKILGSPEAVAVALGLTTAELAQIITTAQARRRRRMNPANSRALKRAARRIKSFHRLCQHTDILKSRGRRASAPVYAFQRRKKCA